jgi:hypothetical protein
MPSSTKKQHKFMEAVAHNPAFAKKAGVTQSVGQDFSNADKGKKFNRGGAMPMDPKMLAMMPRNSKAVPWVLVRALVPQWALVLLCLG